MTEIIIQNIVEIVAALLMTLIGVLGAWLTAKLGKKAELTTINAALGEVISMARLTVDELQQTVVEGLRAAHEDGKLSKEDIAYLGDLLLNQTVDKMSQSTYELLEAAGVDISELIKGAGEAWINAIKARERA